MHLTIVYGTRPESRKLAPLLRSLRAAGHAVSCIRTGQHTSLLSGLVLEPDDWNIGLPILGDPFDYADDLASSIADKLATDGVIVQGDTASAYAGALAAKMADIPLIHVEAGLRTGDPHQPWPEEDFRVKIDQMAQWRFAPTAHALRNLHREHHTGFVTGNTGVDALHQELRGVRWPVPASRQVLVTLHRRESLGEPMVEILRGLDAVALEHPYLDFLWPMHPNPAVAKAREDAGPLPPNFRIVPALPGLPFLMTLLRSQVVVTDSGGVQEEAATLGVPCIVCRDVTDRPESVASGQAVVVGRSAVGVAGGLLDALQGHLKAFPTKVFGDGQASDRIVRCLATLAPES